MGGDEDVYGDYHDYVPGGGDENEDEVGDGDGSGDVTMMRVPVVMAGHSLW